MRLPGTRKTLSSGALLSGIAAVALMTAPAQARTPHAGQSGPQADFPVTVGDPYQIGGVTFVPSDSMNFDSVGYASVGTQGGTAIAAAHHTLPVPSYAEVTDLHTGRTILVRIDRRGPMDGTHAIELSPGAAAQLGIASDGKAPVRVRRVNPPEAERGLLRSGEPAPERMETPKPLLDVLMRKLNPALAQRTLDAADDDAGPARPSMPPAPPKPAPSPATPLPAVMKPGGKPAPAAKMPAVRKAPVKPALATVAEGQAPLAKTGPAGAPPAGYIPSVPAPAASPHPADASHTRPKPHASATGASFAQADGETKPAKAEAAKPQVAKPEATKPEAAGPSDKDAFTIQAGAFSDKARAQSVADKIGGTLSPAGKMWRVRVGPYTGHGSAEAALAKVKSAGYSGARILRAE